MADTPKDKSTKQVVTKDKSKSLAVKSARPAAKKKKTGKGKGASVKKDPRVNSEAELNFKQRLFAKEYLVDLNAKQAAIRAGYSANTAEVSGCRLLSHVKVAAAIQEGMNKRAERIEITAERVLQEVAKLSFANLQDFYNENGSFKEIHALPREVAAALASVKVNYTSECAVQEVKLHDKKGSLELLGKHLMLWRDVGSKENPLTLETLSIEQLTARLAALELKANGA